MAGKPVGTIYAELDLDASKYTKAQKEILKSAQQTTLDIEKNWKTLGSQSDLLFDAQRKGAENAYNMIANSAKSSSAEIERARESLARKIETIDQKQFGTTKKLIDETTEAAQNGMSVFGQMFGAFTLANFATQAIYGLKNAITELIRDGLQSVEDVKLSTASLAATITTFAKGSKTDLAGTYKQAYDYAGQVVHKMEEWDAETVATGKNLMAMVETMAQGGVLLDVNNKKQKEGFIAIANALALLTQGQNQDIQFRQEIRGLIDGEERATNRLAVLLGQKVGGSLKDHVEKWKEQGTLIENAGLLLVGFTAAAKDIDSTWLAVKSTLETMYHRVLRGMFTPVYEDIIRLGKQISLNMMDQDSTAGNIAATLRDGMYKTWESIKNILRSAWEILSTFEGPIKLIGAVTSTVFDGWGMIFAILPPILERVKWIGQSMWDIVKAAGNVGSALYSAASLDFKGMAENWKSAKQNWSDAGTKTGKAFSGSLLEEIDKSLADYNKKQKSEKLGTAAAPELNKIKKQATEEMASILAAQTAANKSYFDEQAMAADHWLRMQKISGINDIEMTREVIEKKLIYLNEWYDKQADSIIKNVSKEGEAKAKLEALWKEYNHLWTKLNYEREEITAQMTKKAEDDAVKLIEKEIALGVKISADHLKGAEEYRKMKSAEADFGITETQRAINAITFQEGEKLVHLKRLYEMGWISFVEYEELKVKISANAVAARLLKETEHALKVAKTNYDSIKDIRGWEQEAFNARIDEINQEADRRLREGANAVKVAVWVKNETVKAEIEKGKAANDFFGGVKAGYQEMQVNAEKTGLVGYNTFRNFMAQSERAMSDLFFDTFKGKTKDLGEYLVSFWDAMLRNFTDVMAKMLMKWIMTGQAMSIVNFGAAMGATGGGGGGATGGLLGLASKGFDWVKGWLNWGSSGGGVATEIGDLASLGFNPEVLAGLGTSELIGGAAEVGLAAGIDTGMFAGLSAAELAGEMALAPETFGLSLLPALLPFIPGVKDITGGIVSGISSVVSDIGSGIGNFFSSIFHEGGLVGYDYSPMRAVPALAFAGAPRLHNGFAPDEFPAILQRGERVLSRKENARYENGGGSFSPVFKIFLDGQEIKGAIRIEADGVIVARNSRSSLNPTTRIYQ
jgi:hypothetical protein